MSAQEFRTDSDYLDFYVVSNDDALKQIKDAEDFIAMIESYIAENYTK